MSSSNPKKKARVSISTEENLSLANQTPVERDGDDIRIYDQDKSLKRKEFWNDYNPYRDKDNKKRAECIHCRKTFAADSMTNGTTHLSRHWKACVRNPRNKIKGTQSKLKLVKVEESVPCEMESWVLNQSEAEKAFVRMVAMGELPLQLVEHYTVKRFLTSLNPEFIVPSLVSVARDCYKLFLKEKDKLGEFLKESCQRVCLTTDSWISIHGEDYITLTAHFIDNDWKLQKRVLNFCYTDDTCEEFTLARVIKDCLTSWGLCDKIFSITVEDSNPNDVACVNLRQMVIENGTCINHGKNLKFMCVARIMNLIVWDVLEEYSSLVDKVRAVIMPVRNFSDRLHVFKEQARKLGVECKSSLRTDEPTKWNSIYRMLDVAVKYKDVFAELEPPVDEDGSFIEHISPEEWMRIEKLANFLKAFYDLASHVSSSSVTLNTVFFHIVHVFRLLDEWAENSDPVCRSMSLKMKMKCNEYWGDLEKMNMLIFVAIILDPAYKYVGLQYSFRHLNGREAGDSLATRVKEFAEELFSEYRSIYDPVTPLQSEFDRYLLEENAFGEEDILTWWRLNGPRFPILARMARDVLAVPVSTLSSEYAFSNEGRILSESRSSLPPKMLQALVCTQDWLGEGSQEYESDEDFSSEEIDELEKDLQDCAFFASD